MRYELNDFEWTAIKPMLPNKTRGASASARMAVEALVEVSVGSWLNSLLMMTKRTFRGCAWAWPIAV
jgi:hypothetical protein